MKGRGTRTISLGDLQRVTPSARNVKDHFVIVDAVGVTKSVKTDSRPLERKPSISLKDLLKAVSVGASDENLFTTLAGRLARLDRQMTSREKEKLMELSEVKAYLRQLVRYLKLMTRMCLTTGLARCLD